MKSPINPLFNGTVQIQTPAGQPESCLQHAPVAVCEGERVPGYLVDPHHFEDLMAMAKADEQKRSVDGRSRLTGDELRAIGREGARLLGDASERDMAMFSRFQRSATSNDELP